MPGFSGQGIVTIAKRQANGLPGAFRDIGNASIFELGLTEETVERNESRTGSRLPYRKLTKGQAGSLKIVFDEHNIANFALVTRGVVTTTTVAGTPVTGYVLPPALVAGDIVIVPAKNITAVAIKDSTPTTPKTLPPAGYTVDAFSGAITLLDVATGGAYVQPFKADFTPGATTVSGAFKGATNDEYYVRLTGINTDTNSRGVHDIFRVRIPPAKALALISNDFLDFELDSSVLADLTRLATDPEGQFYSFTPALAEG